MLVTSVVLVSLYSKVTRLYIYTYIFFPIMVYYIEYSSLGYTVGPC